MVVSGKVVVFGISGVNRPKKDCIWAKVVVFGQRGCFGQSGCIRAKMVVFGQKWMYSCKVVLILQSGCVWTRVIVIRQKWMYSGKEAVFGQKWCYSGKS